MAFCMSAKELDRLKLMRDLERGKLTQKQAAKLLRMSERQIRRIVRRYKEEGTQGLVHRSRGRPSNRKVDAETHAEAIMLMNEEQFHDYGPTLLSEAFEEDKGLRVSRETMRKWMTEEGRWKPRKAKVHHRQWRERKACFGEMVQMDTSIHDWFEGRGEKAVLIAMIDDAGSKLFCRFHPSDSTASNMSTLRAYIRRHGRPRSVYVDKASHFTVNRAPTPREQRAGKCAQTQIQRALEELDIEHITAHSPPGQGAGGTLVRHLAGPAAEGNAAG